MHFFLLNSSPLQLIYAEELKIKYKLSNEDCILILRKLRDDNTKRCITTKEMVYQFGQWSNVIFVDQIRFNSFYGYIKNCFLYIKSVEKIFKEYNSQINSIILGNYGNESMRHIANKYGCHSNKIVFIDEGIGTLHLYKSRENGSTGSLKRKNIITYFYKILIQKFKRYGIGLLNNDISENVTFFTQFELKSTNKTTIITTRFENLQQFTKYKKKGNTIYLIGNSFIATSTVKRDSYFYYLEAIQKKYSGFKIIYFPHRRELKSDIALIRNQFQFQLANTEDPIEIYLLNQDTFPKEIVGFTSSALPTIRKMFGTNIAITAFRIPDKDILNKKDIIQKIYHHFATNLDFNISKI